jgi:hypothetical protein
MVVLVVPQGGIAAADPMSSEAGGGCASMGRIPRVVRTGDRSTINAQSGSGGRVRGWRARPCRCDRRRAATSHFSDHRQRHRSAIGPPTRTCRSDLPRQWAHYEGVSISAIRSRAGRVLSSRTPAVWRPRRRRAADQSRCDEPTRQRDRRAPAHLRGQRCEPALLFGSSTVRCRPAGRAHHRVADRSSGGQDGQRIQILNTVCAARVTGTETTGSSNCWRPVFRHPMLPCSSAGSTTGPTALYEQ